MIRVFSYNIYYLGIYLGSSRCFLWMIQIHFIVYFIYITISHIIKFKRWESTHHIISLYSNFMRFIFKSRWLSHINFYDLWWNILELTFILDSKRRRSCLWFPHQIINNLLNSFSLCWYPILLWVILVIPIPHLFILYNLVVFGTWSLRRLCFKRIPSSYLVWFIFNLF